MKNNLFIVVIVMALIAGGLLWQTWSADAPQATPTDVGGPMVEVQVPASFTEQETIGKRAFDAACADCHGENATGREGVAPPLVHKIYEPSHHADMAFVLAAQNGVRSHHWKFGDMPPVEGVTRADVLNIVAYVRALQRQKRHRMTRPLFRGEDVGNGAVVDLQSATATN